MDPCTKSALNATVQIRGVIAHNEDALQGNVGVEDESAAPDDRFNESHESDEDILRYKPLELDQVQETNSVSIAGKLLVRCPRLWRLCTM
jgi:hypothetical protein